MDKDTKKILDAAKRQGFTVVTTRRGHRQVLLSDRLITTSREPRATGER